MKTRKPPSYVQAIIVFLIMAAVMAAPLLWGSYSVRPKPSEQKLAMTIRYTNVSQDFEMAKDIIVATDREFKNVIEITNSVSGVDGRHFYQFNSPKVDKLEKVYIQSPILYVPMGITKIDVPLAKGQVAKMHKEDTDFETAGKDWFYIDDIAIEEISKGYHSVKVIIKAIGTELPHLPELKTGDKEISGQQELYFDESGCLEYGEFIYSVKNDAEIGVPDMEDWSLIVSKALIWKKALRMNVESNVDFTLSV